MGAVKWWLSVWGLVEEGRVRRDLSSLIVFMAQTQLSPPVTLWLSDSAQKQSAPFVCDLSHYYTVVPSSLLCCCGRQLASSKLIRHCNDSLNARFTQFSGLHCGVSVCVRNFYRCLEKRRRLFFFSPRICADTFYFFFCSIWKESGRTGKKVTLELWCHIWHSSFPASFEESLSEESVLFFFHFSNRS